MSAKHLHALQCALQSLRRKRGGSCHTYSLLHTVPYRNACNAQLPLCTTFDLCTAVFVCCALQFLDYSHADPDTPVKLYTVPLCQAMSISSSFLAVASSNGTKLAQQLASTEEFVNWGVQPSTVAGDLDAWLACFRKTAVDSF